LAAAAGRTNQQIAAQLQMPEVTVSKWRRNFVCKGLEGIKDAPRSGRPVKHTRKSYSGCRTEPAGNQNTTAVGVLERWPKT
jgi:transposase